MTKKLLLPTNIWEMKTSISKTVQPTMQVLLWRKSRDDAFELLKCLMAWRFCGIEKLKRLSNYVFVCFLFLLLFKFAINLNLISQWYRVIYSYRNWNYRCLFFVILYLLLHMLWNKTNTCSSCILNYCQQSNFVAEICYEKISWTVKHTK